MTMINTSDDILSLLNENDEFRDAVRRAILTEDLLTLPAVFADLRYALTSRNLETARANLETARANLEMVKASLGTVSASLGTVSANLEMSSAIIRTT